MRAELARPVAMERKNSSVLLVSNDEYWIGAVKEAIAPDGFVVDTACGSTALNMIRDRSTGGNPYALVIVDMIAENAHHLINQIRQEQPKIKIVAATSAPTWRLVREIYRAGAADYIIKSRDRKRLASELHTLLK